MGVRFSSQFSNAVLGPLTGNSNPNVILQIGPVIVPFDNAPIALAWSISIAPSSSTTALVFALFRNAGGAGVAIGASAWQHTVALGAVYHLNGNYVDQPGGGSLIYSMTIAQLNATAPGTINDACLLAFIL
jgi:hypothetical protein